MSLLAEEVVQPPDVPPPSPKCSTPPGRHQHLLLLHEYRLDQECYMTIKISVVSSWRRQWCSWQ
jgi:hypothetical protein